MREFTIQGIKLRLADDLLSSKLIKSFERGWYENTEAAQLPRCLKDGDRILELGGGVGFLSTLANKIAKIDKCTVIEANPDLIPVIKETHSINGVSADVRNRVATSRRGRIELSVSESGEVPFYRRENFWGSSLDGSWRYQNIVHVAVIDFQSLVDEVRPSVIVCDIEGGEGTMFDRSDLSTVRHIIMEVHKGTIGLKGINDVVRSLGDEGLFIDPDGTTGGVFLFSRPN